MALTLGSGVAELPGIGAARAKCLEKLGLATAGDLLDYFPRNYEDRTRMDSIATAPEGEPVCILALVAETPRVSYLRRGLELTKVKVVDDGGAMTVTFFNKSYVRSVLQLGERYVFYGKVTRANGACGMANPAFEGEGHCRFTGCIMPVYPLTAGISNNRLAGLTRRCVDGCAAQIPECLPEALRQSYALAGTEFSYENVHFPTSPQALEQAKRRLIFEELFYLTCGMALLKNRRQADTALTFAPTSLAVFLGLLPFAPTGAQRRAMEEVERDTLSGRPMNRLVQGDVGSGKTVVAAYGAWLAAQNGCQAAMMAPTEILAQQHYRTLTQLLAPAGIVVGLLTGSSKAGEKKQVCGALKKGEIHLLVGTHALFSKGVEFQKLGLVITDEQHRFGVGQRAALSAKAEVPPHVLVMSATPIPRTLALMIYGDLDVSVMDELPPGRRPVETFLVGEDKRQRLYGFVRKLVGEGRQAYIVCPAVGETPGLGDSPGLGEPPGLRDGPGLGEAPDLKAVTAYAQQLQAVVFPELRVGLVHGKLRPKEKDAVMEAFAAGALDVLVSTTVIEVGVDVPNAALMVVENAERFGLSQLHQLRGRVGRGEHQSYCILVSSTRAPETRARLKVLVGTTDGFKISEEDLKLRGPGDFFGARQHGLPQLRIADLAGDMRVLKQAQLAAEDLLRADPTLEKPENRPLLERVKRLFAEHENGLQ